ncbi:MAG: helix-turn-helix domain-containing protein [Planctomycetaceae bacterium]|nr:helix-turn-helix domain-containing protein [Planctomycetaceae bacterium]
MPLIMDENGKRIVSTAGSRLIRKNYRSELTITKAEAAKEAGGISVKTIERWIREGCFPLARRVGPARIPFDLFLRYLQTGERQIGPGRNK